MIQQYAQMRETTDGLSVSVYNATVGEGLEAFEGLDYLKII